MQADGRILAGGFFSSIGGQTRNRIARLDATSGAADSSFDANADGIVTAIVLPSEDKILVGGSFQNIGGQPRNAIARLEAATGLADAFDPSADNTVNAIAIQADTKILVGAGFQNIGGRMRSNMARLDPVTGQADSFDPSVSASVLSIAVQPDGRILIGGYFFGTNSVGGATRNFMARLDPTTGVADSFDPSPNITVFAIAVQVDGKILAGGAFSGANGIAGQERNGIARLETGGGLDRTLDLSMVGSYVLATAVQADGKILIGGAFSSVLGVTRNHIARLNADGTLDAAFNPNANGVVYAITVQADGKILVGGFFSGTNSIAGGTRNHLARLNQNGTLDPFFSGNANERVVSIVVQPDGKILVGGYFNGANSIGGATRNYIARLDAKHAGRTRARRRRGAERKSLRRGWG